MSQVHTCEGPSASSSGLTLAGWVAWRRRSRLWPAARVAADNGQALTQDERQAVLSLINTEAYADLSIGQIWARELDEGRYLCSASSMYRIARAAGQSRERRRQATHPAKGIFYQLYVLIDIYSRFNPSWIISPVEDSLLATDFIAEAIERNGAVPHTVHADRGTSMTSQPVSALLADLGVTRSHSRPRVCPLTGQCSRLGWSATRRAFVVAGAWRGTGATCVVHGCRGRSTARGTRRRLGAGRRL